MKKKFFLVLLGLVSIMFNFQVMAKPASISFDVCGESRNWVRPSLSQQIQHIQTISYLARPNEQILKDDLQTGQLALVWKNFIISFDTYGLHLTMEVWNGSGMWILPTSTIERCMDGDNVMKIRDGKMAWIFLLQHRVRNLKWQNNHYVLEVEPTKTGLQVIQFDRRDRQSSLPLKVIDQNGQELNSSNRGWEDSITVWY